MIRIPKPQSRIPLAIAVLAFVLASACGKKGPPLPPLVKLPQPPADLAAERRGATVDLQFTVPAVNTDGSKPANVASVEVYAITAPTAFNAAAIPGGPPILSDADILKFGTKVGTVSVKAPKDPNQTVDEDEADADVDPPEGKGLDQGAIARVAEDLTGESSVLVVPPKLAKQIESADADGSQPLLPPPAAVPSRTYVSVGVSARGKKGPVSKRIAVPLVPPPPSPAGLKVTYDESAITVAWRPSAGVALDADDTLLPARPIGAGQPRIGYNVYELPPDPDVAARTPPIRLNRTPITAPEYVDERMTWGAKRCYQVRAVATIAGAAIESVAPPSVCETLVDTFPPAAPKSLQAVPSDGAISLIWEPNSEKDLAGYLVFRAVGDADLQPITPAPITATTFKDDVQSNVRYAYAVKAVDKAGNVSPISNRVEEIAR